MVTFPNAKINLGLDILRKRPDGYHDISTVMIPVPWKTYWKSCLERLMLTALL